ncbi:AAA domain-containing protein [Tenacibaculum finnmarkense]|uniref:AAA domain-containing protein n=1 Tax=Tenacibaculum finnmarkense TaxID=2781243 RepID=UPI001E46D2A5|nr:AAA domain-containing protein [Tenacibaculum finnmarkense]MCD8413586.1 AAA domain-containing protein [Tenacibaculum finnmarkense genomovar ulcerans]
MILDKYQLYGEIQNRGYSSTAKVIDKSEEIYFAKWIKGIEQNSQPSKILYNKLRHLKKAVHSSLPKIIEYEWDESQSAYCIIFENKNATSLEENIFEIKPTHFLKGIEQIANCLQQLQQKHKLAHGDITPANILVDENFDFYLIDFGVSDISATLSQSQELEIFAKEFASPEKWDRKIPKGFPYQSDIYSIGKVIEWYFAKNEINEFEEVQKLADKTCEQLPIDRINYVAFLEHLLKITSEISFDNQNTIYLYADEVVIEDLNNPDFKPKFDISPRKGENILLNISSKNFYLHCIWKISENGLNIINSARKEDKEKEHSNILRFGKELGFPIIFTSQSGYNEHFNLTPFFKKIQKEKQHESEYRKGKREITKELKFFKYLLTKEMQVLEKNSLRLRFVGFEKKGNYEISFKIQDNEKYSKNGLIFSHIDKATPPSPEDFEFIVSETADKKQMKDPMKFSGVAYDFNTKTRVLKFKDCERLDFEKIPKNGYIFENISKQEEEKKRQLEAIRKVEYNEVQNRDLIHYVFNPTDLQGKYLEFQELKNIYQTDEKGNNFVYSFNQQKAILNAIHREPLTIIQGPPGTGKTTVITEIVFQILNKNPDAKILITSQTNDAVDNVLDNLLEKEIPIVRLSGIRKPKPSLQKHTLDRKIEGWKEEVRKKTKANWKPYKEQFKKALEKENIILLPIFEIISSNKQWKVKKQQTEKMLERFNTFKGLEKSLTSETEFITSINSYVKVNFEEYFLKQQIFKDWLATISSLDENSNINQKLIDSIRVIGATTNHIASKKYQKYNFEFDYVIMDESGKATTAEALIPTVLAEKLILVGDHRQLRPMLTTNREVEKWLREKFKTDTDEFDSWDDYFNRPSLFEQVITKIDDDFKSQLEECRRSSKDQVLLTSKCFYEPFGDEPIKPVERPQDKEHNLDLKIDSSIVFLDIGNSYKSEIDGNGSSRNKLSAELIPELLNQLDRFEKVKNYTIGVITGYSAQVREIRKVVRNKVDYRKLKNVKSNNVVISVVDKFQGLEKDIIIFDLVRSQQQTLGFLSNANRINVALSRQKKLLIIVGNLDSILSAKPPKDLENTNQKPALQKYLSELKKDWIVKNVEQIF